MILKCVPLRRQHGMTCSPVLRSGGAPIVPVRTVNGNNLSHCVFVVRCVLCCCVLVRSAAIARCRSCRPCHGGLQLSMLFTLCASSFSLCLLSKFRKSKIKNPERAFARRRISHFACLSRTLPAGRVLSY